MKYILPAILFLSLLLSQKSFAQDIIKFKNGDESKVKVQEITPQEIKYKRFDNQSGPLITVLKNTVSSIQYENGTVEKLTEGKMPVVSSLNAEPVAQVNPFANPDGFSVGDLIKTDYYDSEYSGKVVRVNRDKLTAVVVIKKGRKEETLNRHFYELTLVGKAPTLAGGVQSSYVSSTPSNAMAQPTSQNSVEMLMQGQNDAKRSYDGYHGAGTGTLVTAMLLGPIIGLIPAAACSSTAPTQDRLNFPNPQLVQNISYYTGYIQEAKRVKSRKVWSNYAIGAVISIVAVVALTNTHR